MLVDIKYPDPVPVDLDAKKTLLVIVDMENCSAHPNGPQYMGEPVEKIIPRIARLRDYVRSQRRARAAHPIGAPARRLGIYRIRKRRAQT